jgi:toxin ParE1/3/4
LATVRWSLNANQNFYDIATSLSRRSFKAASTFVEAIDDAVSTLETYPRIGRSVPEFQHPSYRELIVGDYRLMYETEHETVILLAIIHGRRHIGGVLIENPESF